MNFATLLSRAGSGVKAPLVSVEAHISNGLPSFSIVGLPETTVKESKHRVRGALLQARFEFPARRITVNLAPADLPKEGGRFDLPIAISILIASGQISSDSMDQYEFAGELALSGELRRIKGALPFALGTRNAQRKLIIAADNAEEVALANHLEIYPAKHLLEVCEHFNSNQAIRIYIRKAAPKMSNDHPDMADVRGQQHAKRALEIAASGGHSLLLYGPPGTGKSMLASRLPGILPAMTDDEAIETAAVLSIANNNLEQLDWKKRPFRTPHHSASGVALVGGGSPPRPGEISLAHNGVLFLDELPEFERRVLEALREPLEAGSITISRAARQAEFPARFQLIAAMNPCPCGYNGDPSGRCRCTAEQVQRYRNKISGPLLDRIDMHVEMPRIAQALLLANPCDHSETSTHIQARVITARELQLARSKKLNSQLNGKELDCVSHLSAKEQQLLHTAMTKLNLSARAYHRILRIARTLADMEQSEAIQEDHISEALGYRCLDRQPAGL